MTDTDIDAINKNTYNFYLVIEVPDHVYVLVGKIKPIRIKDIYMIRYFYHKIKLYVLFIFVYSTYFYFYFIKGIEKMRKASFHFVEPPDNRNYGRSK